MLYERIITAREAIGRLTAKDDESQAVLRLIRNELRDAADQAQEMESTFRVPGPRPVKNPRFSGGKHE